MGGGEAGNNHIDCQLAPCVVVLINTSGLVGLGVCQQI